MPDAAASATLAPLVVAFSAVARACGLTVPLSSEIDYAAALGALAPDRPESTYWAGRACFVHRVEEIEAYNRAYAAFWLGQTLEKTAFPVLSMTAAAELEGGSADEESSGGAAVYSRTERLGERDFATLTSVQRAEMQLMMASLRTEIARRRTRRWRSARSGRRLDLRRSVGRAIRTEGLFVEPARRRRRERPRRVVLLLDVSGSMDPYVTEFVRFLQVAVSGLPVVEAFSLGTRLTRLTRQLAVRDPDAALRAAAASTPDWSGGTRLGEALREFNDRYGIRGLARGSFIVILSDGIDRGDPALLAGEMARISRVAYRVVWANPLKGTPGYLPTARGMAAALPYVDDFLPGHSLHALAEVARAISA